MLHSIKNHIILRLILVTNVSKYITNIIHFDVGNVLLLLVLIPILICLQIPVDYIMSNLDFKTGRT